MDILISEVNEDKFTELSNPFRGSFPFWLKSELVNVYEKVVYLAAFKGDHLIGLWPVPCVQLGGLKMAKRNLRFFPYSSPFITYDDNLSKREVTIKFFEFLIENFSDICLPFSPDFKFFAPIQAMGGFVEWRHTHHLREYLPVEKLPGRLKNHLMFAKRNLSVTITNDSDQFKFDQAIRGNKDEVLKRKELAVRMLNANEAIILAGKNTAGELVSGVFVAYDKERGYLMHSWMNDDAPRGTLIYLIHSAWKETVVYRKLPIFDLEGSVLQTVDYFYSGFNGEIVPYGFVYWSKDNQRFNDMIQRSISIPGRLYSNNKVL